MQNHSGFPTDDRAIVLLEEIVRLARFVVLPEVRRVAQEKLDSKDKKRVFGLTDGERSVREIARITNVNKDIVSKWWREWQSVGLVESVDGRGTRRTTFPLDDLGL